MPVESPTYAPVESPAFSEGLGSLLEESGVFDEILAVAKASGCDTACLNSGSADASATVFLPVDGWLEKLDPQLGLYLGADTVWAQALRMSVALYAAIPGTVYSADLNANSPNQTNLTTWLGEPMVFSEGEVSTGNSSSVIINGGAAEIVLPDVAGEENATLVVQGTSALLLPPSFPNETVHEIASGLSTAFFAALYAANLSHTFNQTESITAFTLFVPTNEAFAAQLAAWNTTLDKFTSDEELNLLLEQLMQLHWVANAAISTAGLALWPLIWTAGGLVPSSLVLDHLTSADLAGLDGLVNSLDTVIVTAWLNESITLRLSELAVQ